MTMSPADLTVILGPVAAAAATWIYHAVRAWLRHRHGAP